MLYVIVAAMEEYTEIPCRLLDWDSAHFGVRIGRVTPTKLDAELCNKALAWADLESIECMYFLADSSDADTIRLASSSGWRLVDVRVKLGAKLSGVPRNDAGRVRKANVEDIPYLKQLAKRAHKDSRFYADGNFPASACDELFASWIERSVRDRAFAGAVFVPTLVGDQPAGYITCAVKDGAGEIGLIAVDEKARRTGLGTSLLSEAATWFAGQGAQRVSVVTQGANITALRMYERFGFSVESLQLWFHWWRELAPGRLP
jgi:dTDP-4-amino-4,6-dideoxy-D-galactose acyltransferase